MQYIMYLLKKLKKEKKMYLLLCEIFYYNSRWGYSSGYELKVRDLFESIFRVIMIFFFLAL